MWVDMIHMITVVRFSHPVCSSGAGFTSMCFVALTPQSLELKSENRRSRFHYGGWWRSSFCVYSQVTLDLKIHILFTGPSFSAASIVALRYFILCRWTIFYFWAIMKPKHSHKVITFNSRKHYFLEFCGQTIKTNLTSCSKQYQRQQSREERCCGF